MSFGALQVGSHVGTAVPLFNRIDSEKMLEEIENEIDAAKEEREKDAPFPSYLPGE